jgi:hypothetical protein
MKILYHQVSKVNEEAEYDDEYIGETYHKNKRGDMRQGKDFIFGGLDGIVGDLRMNEKEIIGKFIEEKKLRRFYASLSKRINEKLIK